MSMSVLAKDGQTLLVSEVFGPTLQGEGVSLGQTVGFVRLGCCNLHCKWCDTPYTWDSSRFDLKAELAPIPVADIHRKLMDMRVARVVISGGEPLLQHRRLRALLSLLADSGIAVEIETNGTIAPSSDVLDLVSLFTVSPKLANSGEHWDRRIRPEAIAILRDSGKAVFKFVASRETDLVEISSLVGQFDLRPVYVMPEGTTVESQIAGLRQLAPGAISLGYRITPRLHVLLWGNERGR
jgi:7-carboxy-7-deazaguanine synthase